MNPYFLSIRPRIEKRQVQTTALTMETEVVWLDPELPSLSMCAECRHRREGAVCSAYPNGIPERWLFTETVHTRVQDDQAGTDVFEAVEFPTTEVYQS